MMREKMSMFGSKIVKVVNSHVTLENGDTTKITSFDQAISVAEEMNSDHPDKVFLAVDRGGYILPRFTVMEFPFHVGQEVSMAFNGDSYPQGKITKISKDYRIITLENGERFFRRRASEVWRDSPGKTWTLIPGVHNDRNPSF